MKQCIECGKPTVGTRNVCEACRKRAQRNKVTKPTYKETLSLYFDGMSKWFSLAQYEEWDGTSHGTHGPCMNLSCAKR